MVDGSYYIKCTNATGKQSHSGTIKLYQKDGELQGVMIPVTSFFSTSTFRGGKVAGNKFEFTAYWNTPCQQYAMDVKGEVKGDKITGTTKNPAGVYKFEGTRVAK
jgi:hypothetical protein